MRKRIEELDALRGIAAISVVLFHYFFRYNQLFGHPNMDGAFFAYGKYGVELFFIISGFVIFWSLNSIKKPLDFVVSRFSRLYPVYWIAVILTFLFVGFFELPGRAVDLPSFIGNFLMFHDYFDIPSVDGVYWTLKVELTFYLWILVILSLKKLHKINIIILFALILSALIHLKIIHLPRQVKELLMFQWFALFSIGICLYKISNKKHNTFTFVNLTLSLLITILIFSFKSFIIYSCFTIILYLAVNNKMSFLRNKKLIFLGTISYSLYLIHQNIGYIIIRKGYQYDIHPIISITIAIIFTIGLSFLLNKYIEKPTGKFIKKIYKLRQPTTISKQKNSTIDTL